MATLEGTLDKAQLGVLLKARYDETAEQLRVQSESVRQLRRSGDQGPGDVADAGTMVSDTEQQDLLTAALDDHMRKLTDALARFESGALGTCDSCGQEIPLARMEIMPWSTHCVKCQAAAERWR
ncbi:molecular chaperone DnaK [Catellatospora methionotrophica]|uniref:Molecular chaperone DnaK n=2 Tax=Catellatospora methionotrophica TaxID=121620 RepID=A0A8J3LI57_9ACTN|nr:TraR/DksA C4-type zinc finger protein [Catellatospora methionotrophica]GIG18665.1 molecular chaperone DnaK [Catellatospora methionotrophica]